MSAPGTFPLAWRIARRELRSGVRGFGVFLACIALGVAAVGTVGSLSATLEQGLRTDARRILGGDVEVRRSHEPIPAEAVEFLEGYGDVSNFVRLRAMVLMREKGKDVAAGEGAPAAPDISPAVPAPDAPGGFGPARAGVLSEIKAVDDAYPLVGEVELASGRTLAEALREVDGLPALIGAEALFDRLGAKPGDRVTVGSAQFVLTDVIISEPDRVATFYGLGPRIIFKRDYLPATDLLRPGAVTYYFYLLNLSPEAAGPTPASRLAAARRVQSELAGTFPDSGWRIRDYTQTGWGLKESLDNMGKYLTLVGLVSLLVGGIGVANAVRGYLSARAQAVAAMKCVGASSRLIITAYLMQVLILAAAGCVIGSVAAVGVTSFGSAFLADTFKLAVSGSVQFPALLTASAFGLLTAVLFSVGPLAAAGAVAPSRLFRGYAVPLSVHYTLRRSLVVLGLCAALALLVWAVTADMMITAGFVAASGIGAALFLGMGAAIGALARRMPRLRDPRLRQAVAGLHRPGASTASVAFSLGLGLTALVAVSLVDGNLQQRIRSRIPEVAPSFFFIDIPSWKIEGFLDTVRDTPGVSRVEYEPSLRGRITHIDGVPSSQVTVAEDVQWALRGDRGLTYSAEKPEKTEVVAGEWWPPDYSGPPLICLSADIGRGFGVGIGDTLTVNIQGRSVTASIGCLREVDWSTLALNHAIVFAPGVLENAPKAYITTAYCDTPESERELFRRVLAGYPDVVTLRISDILSDVASLMTRVGFAVRATAAVTLLAGLLVLAEALRANLRGRHYDAVVFKVLGATRRDILTALAAEFSILGLTTALGAAVLGTVLARVFVVEVLSLQWSLLYGTVAVICFGGVAATVGLGLLGVRGALGRKAWPVLRNE